MSNNRPGAAAIPALTEAFGIDAIKAFLRLLVQQLQATYTIDTNRNGKVDLNEGVAYGTGLFTTVVSAYPLISPVRQEGGDLSAAEIDELINYIVSLQVLPGGRPNAEAFLDRTLLWLNYNRKYIGDAIAYFRSTPA
jgi:hypothetical protein